MRHLQKFEAFSDYTKKIKEIGGKIGDKIGGIFGNPSKAIKSVGNDIKNTANLKIYNTEEYRLAALALISINDDFDKFNNELRGEYAIVIFKQHKKTDQIEYFVSTDPLSVRPMFYYMKNNY